MHIISIASTGLSAKNDLVLRYYDTKELSIDGPETKEKPGYQIRTRGQCIHTTFIHKSTVPK